MTSTFFSIITPTYNRPDMLLRSVQSVLKQTFQDFEIIVVNDGSVVEYDLNDLNIAADPRIKYFKKENEGPSIARNYGIENASGKFICFLDDDDEFLENHLSVLYNRILKENNATGLYRTLTFVERNGNCEKQKFEKQSLTINSLDRLYSNLLVPCSVAVSSDILKKTKFSTIIPISEDYDLWTKIVLKDNFFEIMEYTSIYHLHEGSASSGNEELVHIKHINAFKQTFHIPGVKNILSAKIRNGILYNRYLWLSETQLKNKNFLKAIINRVRAILYKYAY